MKKTLFALSLITASSIASANTPASVNPNLEVANGVSTANLTFKETVVETCGVKTVNTINDYEGSILFHDEKADASEDYAQFTLITNGNKGIKVTSSINPNSTSLTKFDNSSVNASDVKLWVGKDSKLASFDRANGNEIQTFPTNTPIKVIATVKADTSEMKAVEQTVAGILTISCSA
ncbi:hypothetical protein QWZ04_13075 [Vibrio tapetis subsp. quintayensis]|uniref:hypothetical protein n=1 Tax=Vibrio tapetis TaxID=52443 RepID=UPI0025B5CB6C|nr:hypothetical protein [Vibrio tapetis]MDN3681253.1 hypothetical protein [Vibrio tapetis subsp. quintayensis]